jgi:tRNA A-37 threonylcarbamoyl transferase component Bud32
MSVKQCPRCDARFRGDIAACPIDGYELVEPSDPYIGNVIGGRYLVEELLGTGGMGAVYRARHQVIGRDVAMKFLAPSLTTNERQRKRFLTEARAANQINHEHIIDITDFGETDDGIVYLVMELLEGHPLADVIDKGPLEVRRALRIATQVALGLARAHELGVVHRDVKPANIFLTRRRMDRDFVKLLDFGVARIEQDIRITGSGTILGTPEYIAPEQIRSAEAKASADLYALGCVLFEMLTGRLPFLGKQTMLLVSHLNDPAPAPSSIDASIPPEVDKLVLRLLQKKPEQRYRDGYHLVEELQHLLDRVPLTEQTAADRQPGANVGREGLPSEEAHWAHTLTLFRSLLGDAHPRGDGPEWLPAGLDRMSQLLTDVGFLRKQLRLAAEKATELEEEARGPATQIGYAIDALAHDDSRLNRRIEELTGEVDANELQFDVAMQAVLEIRHMDPNAIAASRVLDASTAQVLSQVVRATRILADARRIIDGLKLERQQAESERNDLRFQIAQLKEKLESANASSTLEKELANEEMTRLDSQIQAKLEALAPEANRIAGHFKQFPELRTRLGMARDAETMTDPLAN